MSVFGGSSRKDNLSQHHRTSSASLTLNNPPRRVDTPSSDTPSPLDASPITGTPHVERRVTSRPESTLFSHNPPLLEFSQDTPPELQPIFGYLNSHANKLYHEGYFLKLNDLDIRAYPMGFVIVQCHINYRLSQMVVPVLIASGLNAMRSLSEPLFLYGMPQRWTPQKSRKTSALLSLT